MAMSMRGLLVVNVAVIALLSGCATSEPASGTAVADAWSSPEREPEAAVPAESSAPADDGEAIHVAVDDPVIAVVNGEPIHEKELLDLLIASHGLRVLEERILLMRAQQRAAELSLSVGPKDVDRAHERALEQLQTPLSGDPTQHLDREQAERLLEEFLSAKNLSRQEWRIRMRQQAYLRAIAEAELADHEITERDLQREYQMTHGERVQIRHIQLSSLAAVERAKAQLNRNKDFELVARQLSENQITASQGGLLPAFTRVDRGVSPLIREAAFQLEPGQVSAAIHEGNWYHIIRVEKRIPASGTSYDEVDKDALRRQIMERLIGERQEALESELFNSATVDIRHPVLRKQFDGRHRSGSAPK